MQRQPLIAAACGVLLAAVACGEEEAPPDPTLGSPSSVAAGRAGAAGMSAGAGGSSAGAGGAATHFAVASCEPSTAVDQTGVTAPKITIAAGATAYAPPCIKVKKGAVVALSQSSSHPLRGMANHGTQPNPIHAAEAAGPSELSVTFAEVGSYGFHCNLHGTDAPAGSSGMSGAVYVVE